MPPDLANQFNPLACQADFTYSMTPKTLKIQDTGKGKKSVAEDLEGFCARLVGLQIGIAVPHSRRNKRYLRARAAHIAVGIDALNNGVIGVPGCQPSDFVLCCRATGIESHGIRTSGFGPNRQ